MRIGIVTQPLRLNYGGLLQNYALQRVLLNLGHQPCTLDWTWKREPELRRLFDNAKTRLIWCLGRGKQRELKQYKPTNKEYAVISCNTMHFVNQYISKTVSVTSSEGFCQLFEEGGYEVLITGSDQVWRPKYSSPFLREMFCSFVRDKEVRRIAYAASFGTDEWEYSAKMTEDCALLAKKYDHISVREDSGITLCRDYLGVEAAHVLDPTMLLPKEDYIKLVNEAGEAVSSGTLFYYILDPTEEIMCFVERVAKEMRMEPFMVVPRYQRNEWTKRRIKFHIKDCVYPPITKWLRGFMDAEMTVVDSFHGVVFSIIFNKPFWVIGNKSRGMSRFTSLLKLLGLEDRMLDMSELASASLTKPIDWQRVDGLWEELRCQSLNWLKESLNNLD